MAHSSIDRDSNPLADAPSAFGISHFARKPAPQPAHDSMDLVLDPRLASLSRPARRISTVPRIAIPKFAAPEVVREMEPASAPVLDVSAHESTAVVESLPPVVKPRRIRTQRAAAWAVAAIASMAIGGFTGRLTRPQPRAHAIPAPWAAMRAQPPQMRVVEAAETSNPDHDRVVAPSPIAAHVAMVETPIAAPDEFVAPARGHSSARANTRSNSVAIATETAVAPTPEPAAVQVEAPAAVPVPAARSESRSAANASCSARCGDDLACAAACVVHGSRAESAPEIAARPSAPATAPEAAPTPAPAALEGPSREDVAHAIESVLPSVQACAGEDQDSVAHVSITFASSGRVTTANTEAPYAGTPAGSCIARAVRTARVSPFTRPTFTVRAPFAMR